MLRSNTDNQFIKQGYAKIFASARTAIYLHYEKKVGSLVIDGKEVTKTSIDNIKKCAINYNNQSMEVFIFTVDVSTIYSYIIMSNLYPTRVSGSWRDIEILNDGFYIVKDPINELLYFSGEVILSGKSIRRLFDSVFMFEKDKVIKVVNLELDPNVKHKVITNVYDLFLRPLSVPLCDTNCSVVLRQRQIFVVQPNGMETLFDNKLINLI